MSTRPVSLGTAWMSLHFTVMRTYGVSAVPLTTNVMRAMMFEVLKAWDTATALERDGTTHQSDLDSLRLACMWHLNCVVIRTIVDAITRGAEGSEAAEFGALDRWAVEVRKLWEMEQAPLIARASKHPGFAAEANGELLELRPPTNYTAGGDA